MSELLTVHEMAQRLRLKPDTIRLWTRQGFIPAIRITGKVIRYDADEVERTVRQVSQGRAAKGGDRD